MTNIVNALNGEGVKIAFGVDGVAADNGKAVFGSYFVTDADGVPFGHFVYNSLMAKVFGTKYYLVDVINHNDIRHLIDVSNKVFRGSRFALRRNQANEIGFDGRAFQNGFYPERFLRAANN